MSIDGADAIAARRDPEPARPVAVPVEVGDRRMARLAVRRPGHASLRPGRGPVRRRADRGDRHAERSRRLVQLVDPGRVPGRLGAGRRLLRSRRRPDRPQPGALPDDPHLRAVHRPGLLRANVVATAHRTIPGRPRHRRRVGGRGIVAVGDLAPPLASLDRRRAPDRREHRRPAGLVRDVSAGGPEPSRGLPGRRAACPARVLDPPRGPRDRGMADGQATTRPTRARASPTCSAARSAARPS